MGHRLVTVTTSSGVTTTFTYDGDGQRAKKTEKVGAVLTTTLCVGPVEIISATQRITRTYYAAGSRLIALRVVTSTGGNTLYYFATDHLGTFGQRDAGQRGERGERYEIGRPHSPATPASGSVSPPSSRIVWPRIISAAGEQRKATRPATSSAVTSRPAGVAFAFSASKS